MLQHIVVINFMAKIILEYSAIFVYDILSMYVPVISSVSSSIISRLFVYASHSKLVTKQQIGTIFQKRRSDTSYKYVIAIECNMYMYMHIIGTVWTKITHY